MTDGSPKVQPSDRRAARVVLVNEAGRVLLIEGRDTTTPERGSWWLTPGGGIEAGESAADAAVREVREETGFTIRHSELGDPIWARVAEFEFEGESFRQHEVWFLTRVHSTAARTASPTEQELRSTLAERWWTVDDLISTTAVIHPPDLGTRLRELLNETRHR